MICNSKIAVLQRGDNFKGVLILLSNFQMRKRRTSSKARLRYVMIFINYIE